MGRLNQIFAGLALAAGVALTAWGLAHLFWPRVLPWSDMDALIRYASFLLICTVFIFLNSWWSKKSAFLAGAVVALCFALLAGALWPLLVTLWFAIASSVLGKSILSVLRIKVEEDIWLTSFLVGAGTYGTAVGLLAHFPVNYPGLYGAALAFPLILGWRELAGQAKSLFDLMAERRTTGLSINAIDVAIAVIALVHFVVALMPEVMFDALILHLLVPGHLALRHQWGFDPSLYAMALIPMLGDWLFSIGYMLAGETGARLINLGFTYLLAWQARSVVVWAGGNASGAKWAALLFLATPLTFLETSSLFVESVLAVFVVAGTMAILRLVSSPLEKRGGELKVGGLMLGFAVAAKAVTFSILPALLIPLLFRWRYWVSQRLAPSVIFGLVLFLVSGAIPYFTAWLIAENPIHPFFNGIFNSPYYPPLNFDNALFKSGAGWDLPYKVIFDSGKYLEATNGASGFQWLLLLPVAVITLLLENRRRALLLFVITALSVVMIFHSQSYLRYVYPASLILTAIIGVALSSASEQTGILKKVLSVVAWLALGLNLLFLPAATWSYRDFPLKILLGDSFRNQYLDQRLPVRRAVEFVNYLNAEQAPVAFLSQPFGAGLNADALYPNWYNLHFEDEINKAANAQDIANVLRKYGSSLVLLDDVWSTPEKRKIIEQATDKITKFDSISVRVVRDEYRFGTELLDNPELSGARSWTVSADAKIAADSGSFLVSVASPVSQTIKLQGGIRYINEVTARCGSMLSQGRIQVNLYDSKMQFISSNIKLFDCTADWQDYQQIVIAPKNVAFGIVYGTSHTSTPIEITRISLR